MSVLARATNTASTRLAPLMRRAGRGQAWLYERTGGRLGGRFFGARVCVLEVVGRRSGEPRRVPLLYVEDGDDLVLLASNGGHPKPPAWWLNLRAAGRGHVQLGRDRVAVTAREAGPGERERLLARFVENYPPAADYATYTDRPFPVVLLARSGS